MCFSLVTILLSLKLKTLSLKLLNKSSVNYGLGYIVSALFWPALMVTPSDSREFLCVPTSKVHGYDFAYEGLIGVWEGLQSSNSGIESKFLEPQPLSSKMRNSRRSRSPADDFHGNFHAALTSLTTRRGMDRSSWKPTVSTNRLIQRQVALQLCGWSFKEDEFMSEIKRYCIPMLCPDTLNMARWEKEGKFSRAACWLVFTRQYGKAIELLLRSDGMCGF